MTHMTNMTNMTIHDPIRSAKLGQKPRLTELAEIKIP
jgi:hypothetical protein